MQKIDPRYLPGQLPPECKMDCKKNIATITGFDAYKKMTGNLVKAVVGLILSGFVNYMVSKEKVKKLTVFTVPIKKGNFFSVNCLPPKPIGKGLQPIVTTSIDAIHQS